MVTTTHLAETGTALLLLAGAGRAREIIVDAGGGAEFSTLREAAAVVAPGDIVRVRPGRYDGQVRIGRPGTAEQPIVFRSDLRHGAIVQGSHVNAGKLQLAKQEKGSGFFVTKDAAHIIIDGFEVRGFYADGVLLHGSDVTVRNCHIHHNGNHTLESPYGYSGVFSSSSSHNDVFDGNRIHHNGRISQANLHDHGLYLCGNRGRVVNCLIYANCGFGVHVAGYAAADDYVIVNNTIAYQMRGSAIAFWKASKSGSVKRAIVRNNILAFNAWYAIDFVGSDGYAVTHNVIFGNGQLKALPGDPGYDGRWQKELRTFGDDRGWFFAYDHSVYTAADNIDIDPRFVDPTAGDLRVRPGSRALDRGTPEDAPDTDIGGRRRPQGSGVDIGAWETLDE